MAETSDDLMIGRSAGTEGERRDSAPTGAPWPHVDEVAQMRRAWPRWIVPVGVGLVALAGAVVLANVEPTRLNAATPGCPFRLVTGLDCPGCGGTRAMQALLAGQPLRALDHNIVTVSLLPLFGTGWWRWLRSTFGHGRPLDIPARWGIVLAVTLGVFGVLRNLPTFAWLGSGVSWSV